MPIILDTKQEISGSTNNPVALDRDSLVEAFESFSHAAGSLENSYAQLLDEVAKLRLELESKNRVLAKSLAENRRMRAYLSGILEALPCGVLAVDGNFNLRYANPQARALLSCGAAHREDSGGVLDGPALLMLKDVAAASDGTERTFALQAREGPKFLAVNCVVPPQSQRNRETVLIIRDVTEARRLEAEQELSRRMQALAEMTAILAHEIRNPLASLELFAALIRDATQGHEEVSQWIIHMQAGLRALSATVNNVLHFHSMAPSQLKPLDLVRLLAETIEFLQPLALQRGMGLMFTPAVKEIPVPADSHRLQQVFFNLTINAFRAMAPGKTLKVRASIEQRNVGMARIDFQDEGTGIPAEHLEKIFDPGFTTVKSSPGLGLAVCKRIMAQHKGWIEVQSTPGKGTTFTLLLPVLN
jgi:signal transduction histidine kinase